MWTKIVWFVYKYLVTQSSLFYFMQEAEEDMDEDDEDDEVNAYTT